MPHTNRGKQNNFILAEVAQEGSEKEQKVEEKFCIILALPTRLSTFAIGPKILMAIRADFQCSNWELTSSLHCQSSLSSHYVRQFARSQAQLSRR